MSSVKASILVLSEIIIFIHTAIPESVHHVEMHTGHVRSNIPITCYLCCIQYWQSRLSGLFTSGKG